MNPLGAVGSWLRTTRSESPNEPGRLLTPQARETRNKGRARNIMSIVQETWYREGRDRRTLHGLGGSLFIRPHRIGLASPGSWRAKRCEN